MGVTLFSGPRCLPRVTFVDAFVYELRDILTDCQKWLMAAELKMLRRLLLTRVVQSHVDLLPE